MTENITNEQKRPFPEDIQLYRGVLIPLTYIANVMGYMMETTGILIMARTIARSESYDVIDRFGGAFFYVGARILNNLASRFRQNLRQEIRSTEGLEKRVETAGSEGIGRPVQE